MNQRLPTRSALRSDTNPIIFCDFDGTVTQIDVTDQILTQFAHPSWREVEQEWVRGTIGSRECLERQMALVEASARELNALIDAIPVDPHFPKFFTRLLKRGVPVYVLSDGFDYVIHRVFRRCGVLRRVQNGRHVFASSLEISERRLRVSFPQSAVPCEHGCATCKAAIIRGLRQDRRPVVFIGDGLSDRFAVDEANIVLAKRPLQAYCRERGIASYAFESFDEVEAILEKLGISTRPRRRRVAVTVAP